MVDLYSGVPESKFNVARFSSILPNPKVPIVFKNIENGKEERIVGSFSWYNSGTE